MKQKACKDCVYWRPVGTEGDGECRKSPPVVMSQNDAFFPITFSTQWCGELRPKASGMPPGLTTR